jgi:acyl dehydratase
LALESKNQRGEVVLCARSDMFIKGPRKRENLEAEKAARDADELAWQSAPPVFTSTETVDPDQSRRYANASGDHNAIHVDEDVAKMAGLPSIILHGLCTMAFVHNALVRHAGGKPLAVKRLAVRFARPVLMGDVLTIEARGETGKPLMLRVHNQNDVDVLKNGVAELA